VRRVLPILLLLSLAGGARADDHMAPDGPQKPRAGRLRAERTIPDTVRFDQLVSSNEAEKRPGSLVRMTVTNYGFYGNNFFKRDASLEYPAGRGIEHMVRGGLWVGAHAQDPFEFTGVTTGTVDAAQGPTSPEGSEFTPGDKEILQRSTLPKSPFASRDAVSELDLISDFNDLTPTHAASNPEIHRPLHIAVHHENYQWGFAEFKNIMFFHITITNVGAVMESVWVGMYTEFTSGNKAGYVIWPPGAGDLGGLGGWFNKKLIAFDSTFVLLREHYCNSSPVPDNCKFERAPYWIGLRYLGARGIPNDTTTRKLTLAAWSWSGNNPSPFRDQDVERYKIMSSGKYQPLGGDSVSVGTGDPVELFATGPFPSMPHNSSISVDYAIVGGAEVSDLQKNSTFAQFAYDHNYVLPVPPPSPQMHVVARDTAVDIYWDHSSELAYDVTSPNPRDFEGYRVNIGQDPDSLIRVAQFDISDSSGFNTGFPTPIPLLADSVTFDGVDYFHYKYSIHGLRNGFKYYCAVTAFDLGNSQIEPLESSFSQNRVAVVPGPAPGERKSSDPIVFPNPYRVEARWDQGKNVRDHYLWFTNLPKHCELKIFTLSGDQVFRVEFDGDTYQGEGARGIYNPALGLGKPTLSGTTYGWNLISSEGQAVASGLYLFSVEDHKGGKRHIGKFLIVKSDREAVR
jgi:hypothetical protein